MTKTISFHNLPFTPTVRQVIYIEGKHSPRLNKYIRKHQRQLNTIFSRYYLEFCYMPLLTEQSVEYQVPFISKERQLEIVSRQHSLIDYADNPEEITPSLVFATYATTPQGNALSLECVEIHKSFFSTTRNTFHRLAKEINKRIKETYSLLGLKHFDYDEPLYRLAVFKDPDLADKSFDEESTKIIEEIKRHIETLRNLGVDTTFLHDIIDKEEKISRLHITKNFRIFLPDYNNVEICMPALPKAVFLLFLRHPEGIRFKELTDYYSELLEIYLLMKPKGNMKKHENSIKDVTNPCKNSINEKCARIREAFIGKFNERLAQNYFVTGKRGEPKYITLDRTLVSWEK